MCRDILLAYDFFLLHNELQDKRAELDNDNKPKEGKEWQDWAEGYFDNLEWLAYLVNTNQVKDKRMLRFYEKIIIVSYKNRLPTFCSEEKRKDKDFFPEL